MKKNVVEFFKRLTGLLILLSINLLLVKTFDFKLSFKLIVLLSISVWVTINIVQLIIKPFKYVFYLVFTFLLVIYNVLLFIPSNYIDKIIDKYPKLSVITNSFYELSIIKHSKDFIIWFKRYITDTTYFEIPTNYDIALMVIIYIILSMILLFLLIKEVKVRYLLFITIYFLIEWFNYTDVAKTYFNIYFVGLILYYYILNYKDKVALAEIKKFRYKQYTFRKNLLFGFIFALSAVLIATLLTILLPLDIINDKVETFIETGDMFRNEYSSTTKRFSFANTPFQNNSRKLGGPIELDNTIVMEVKSDRNIYLRGNVNNIYDGSHWSSSNSLYYRFRDVSVDSNIKNHKIEINPISIETSTIFSPIYPVKIKINNKKIFFNERYEIYYKDKFLKFKDKNYTIEYVLPNEANNIKLESEINLEDYLSLPEELPERVMDLSKELTKSKNTDYEKIKTLESFLSKNYKYNLNVPNVPNGKDFVDYFLFEEEQGYCTYYASALAVMGRTLGIPTRYVEGFLVHDKPYNKDYYEVKASDAHAWVEAYIEDYGWITLEPTSSYSDDSNDDDEDNDNTDSTNDNNNSNNDRDDLKPILDEDIIDNSKGNYNNRNDRLDIKYIILIVFTIIILVLIIRIIMLFIRNKNKYHKVSNNVSTTMYFKEIYKLYFVIEKPENDNVEVDDLISSLFEKIPKDNQNLHNDEIVRIFNKALYSNNDIFDDEILVLSQLIDLVNTIAIRRLGKFKYFVFKYIIGSI